MIKDVKRLPFIISKICAQTSQDTMGTEPSHRQWQWLVPSSKGLPHPLALPFLLVTSIPMKTPPLGPKHSFQLANWTGDRTPITVARTLMWMWTGSPTSLTTLLCSYSSVLVHEQCCDYPFPPSLIVSLPLLANLSSHKWMKSKKPLHPDQDALYLMLQCL